MPTTATRRRSLRDYVSYAVRFAVAAGERALLRRARSSSTSCAASIPSSRAPSTSACSRGWRRRCSTGLKWVHGYVGDWGWSIIVLTILINLAMFPLRHKSVVSMRRMQELQPQMKAIQDRYAKYKITDPERQKMNTEVMELYKRQGRQPGERLRADAR